MDSSQAAGIEMLEELTVEILGLCDPAQLKKDHKYLRDYHGDYTEQTARKFLKKRARKLSSYTQNAMNSVDEIERAVQAKVKEYLDTFIDPTPNDKASVQMLALLEVQMDRIQSQLMLPDISPEERKNMMDTMKTISAEHRQREHLLGIDKRTRDEDQGGSDMVEKITDIIDQAAAYYEKKIIELNHCGIKLGHLLAHFEDWEFTFTCPRCGEKVTYTPADMKERPIV